MINILLSTYDFSNKYCYSKLKNILQPHMNAIILPFSHDEEYYKKEYLFNDLYNYETGKNYNIICNEFRQYGIEKSSIYVLNPFRDSLEYMKYKINNADIMFGVGGNPIIFMDMLKKLKILEDVKKFKSIFMGASASAMVQVEQFFTYYLPWEPYEYEYYEGLGYVKGIDVIVHWTNNEWQDIAKIISHIERRIPYVNLPDGECLIFNK